MMSNKETSEPLSNNDVVEEGEQEVEFVEYLNLLSEDEEEYECDQCGHTPFFDVTLYRDVHGEYFIEYSDQRSCYSWRQFDVPAHEFLAWDEGTKESMGFEPHSEEYSLIVNILRSNL